MKQLALHIRKLTNRVKDLVLLDVYGRVTQLLQRLADESQKISNPKLTHQDIANRVGASRKMVSRIMKELVTGGYIEQSTHATILKKRSPAAW